jgi:hypothetical protein
VDAALVFGILTLGAPSPCSVSYYQTMHPTILLCGAVYYSAKFYIDKYQITNQYSRGHIQYGHRARTTSLYLVWSMAIGQIGNVVYFVFLRYAGSHLVPTQHCSNDLLLLVGGLTLPALPVRTAGKIMSSAGCSRWVW